MENMENMEMKVCTRCGEEKTLNEFYPVKYKGAQPKYRYSVCKRCTAIEQKRRYLMNVDPENPLLEKIEALYEKHKAAGRSVPDTTRRGGSAIEADIDAMLAKE